MTEDARQAREYCICVIEHLLAAGPSQDVVRREMLATSRRVQSVAVLEQMASSLLCWTEGLEGEGLALLDSKLSALQCPTISFSRASEAEVLRRVLGDGRVSTRNECRIVDAFTRRIGPLAPSAKERAHLLALMDGYCENDEASADTAPMALAWRAAARELRIELQSPYWLRDARGRGVWCSGLLPDFGGSKGALIVGRFCSSEAFELADELGYYTSGLNPLFYEYYERATYEETLNDWGWFGEAAAQPSWFRGGLGRHGGAEERLAISGSSPE